MGAADEAVPMLRCGTLLAAILAASLPAAAEEAGSPNLTPRGVPEEALPARPWWTGPAFLVALFLSVVVVVVVVLALSGGGPR